MIKKLQMGIVGAGKAGTCLAAAFSQHPGAEVKWVVSRTKRSAKRLAEKCRAGLYGVNYEEMLRDRDVSGVVIASPDKFHCAQVVQAAAAGKHVLCEKPMCTAVEEADIMIRAAKSAGVVLMVGFLERFNQPCIEAKERIRRGEIGKPVMVLARRCHPLSVVRGRPWLNDLETGGVLNYAGAHNIDLICDFMGRDPVRVYAEMGSLVLKEQGFTDCAVMTFRFPEGQMAVLYETFAYPSEYPHGVDRSIEILGDRGLIKIDFMSQPLSVFNDGMLVGDSVTWPALGDRVGGAILTEVDHFVSCVLDGADVLTPGEAGRRAIRIAAAAKTAAERGEAVDV